MSEGREFLRTSGIVIAEGDVSETFIQTGGPGGQHVNKVASGVQLRVDIANAAGIPERVRNRIATIASHLVTEDGVLRIDARRHRSQERNRADARERLAAILDEAAKPPPKARIPTRPKRSAVEKRLKTKASRKDVKAGRGRVKHDD